MHWTHEPLVIAYAFIFGAVGGSFLNVLIYRLPREMSILPRPAVIVSRMQDADSLV